VLAFSCLLVLFCPEHNCKIAGLRLTDRAWSRWHLCFAVPMTTLDFTITLTGADPDLAASGRSLLPVVARALRESGIDHACVELDHDESAAGWLRRYHADPLVLQGAGAYTAALESRLVGAVHEVAPRVSVVVAWSPHDPDLAVWTAAGRSAYRLARRLAALDGGAVPARAGLALLDPDRYHDQFTDNSGPAVSLAITAFVDALVDAEALAGVDWKATRTETVAALGRLRILPDGARRIREVVPGFEALVARCAEADRERLGGEPVAAEDPLYAAEDESLQYVVTNAVHAALVALGIDLLVLEDGDTPGYLAISQELAAQLVADARPALIPLYMYETTQ
jgi:hypothetical protein